MRGTWLLILLTVTACPGGAPRCEAGSTVACTCAEGTAGTQACKADGTLETCEPCMTVCGRADCAMVTANASGRRCMAQLCDYASCAEGYSDCDGVRWNGCEYLGFSCPILLASGQEVVLGIAVDETSVYWASNRVDGGGTVTRLPVGGGTPVTLASGQLQPIGVVVDRDSVFWTTATSLMKVALDGGTPVTLASGQQFMSGWLVLDSAFVYWTVDQQEHAVRKVPIGGGGSLELASGQYPGSLAVDGTSLYWTDSVFNEVNRLPLTGGARVTLASPRAAPDVIATDGVSVFWSDYFQLMKAPVDGGPSVVLAPAKVRGLGLVVDRGFVYWADLGGSILKVHVDGGTPITVASMQNRPWGVAVDETWVYWTIDTNDTIWKARKQP